MKSKLTLGIILIVLGVFSYTNRTLQISQDSLILLILSLGFFTVYFLRGGRNRYGNIGFVIPASILLMLGLGTMSSEIFANLLNFRQIEDILIPFSLGTAFLLIFLLHTIHFSSGKKWPLYPMGALYFVTLISAVDVLPVENIIPFILMGIGILLVLASIKKKSFDSRPSSQSNEELIDLRQDKLQ